MTASHLLVPVPIPDRVAALIGSCIPPHILEAEFEADCAAREVRRFRGPRLGIEDQADREQALVRTGPAPTRSWPLTTPGWRWVPELLVLPDHRHGRGGTGDPAPGAGPGGRDLGRGRAEDSREQSADPLRSHPLGEAMTAPAGPRPALLLVTDLAYEARGRRYCDEDIFLASRLREDVRRRALPPAGRGRAAGPLRRRPRTQQRSRPALPGGVRRVPRAARSELGRPVYNPLAGRGDMAGKQYLVELSRAGYPVIPTVDRAGGSGAAARGRGVRGQAEAGGGLGGAAVRRRGGGRGRWSGRATCWCSRGSSSATRCPSTSSTDDFQYALYAPDPERRWVLEPYAADAADLAFARRFIEWNALGHGIQRVDACRTPEGELLLVELEDLNPYLSLDRVDEEVREAFVARLKASVASLTG